jgi:hypothetical protein
MRLRYRAQALADIDAIDAIYKERRGGPMSCTPSRISHHKNARSRIARNAF